MSLRLALLTYVATKEQLAIVDTTDKLLSMLQEEETKLTNVYYLYYLHPDPVYPLRIRIETDKKHIVVYSRGDKEKPYTIQDGEVLIHNQTLQQVKDYLYKHYVE